jgi:hypothetical protein
MDTHPYSQHASYYNCAAITGVRGLSGTTLRLPASFENAPAQGIARPLTAPVLTLVATVDAVVIFAILGFVEMLMKFRQAVTSTDRQASN